MSKTTALAVANFFIEKSIKENISLDHLKLQKLVYFSYAWWSGNHHSNYLFDEGIEAWPHGPVIRDIYVEFCQEGRNAIKKYAQQFDYETYTANIPKVDNTDIQNDLFQIWETYKKFSGIQLSNLTHNKDEPWYIVRSNSDISLKPRIDPKLIQKVYKDKVEKLSNENR